MAYLEREYPSAGRSFRNDDLFTLYVSNLPEELNKDGIAQIFQAFGKIQLISPPNARWAYVAYDTYKEAEHAIRALNNRSPLFLKVSFQKKKQHQQTSHPYGSATVAPLQENLVNDFRYGESGVVPIGSCRNFVPSMVGAQFARYANYHQVADGNLLYPIEVDPNMYNPFEGVGRYAETNAMWSRGCVNVDNYGKRYVSMGRGFTSYNIPEPPPNRESQIGRIYEKRHAGFYEYGEDRLQSGVGKCQLCTRVTTLQCEYCGGFYCSRECQMTDWPRHKMECKTIPGLVGRQEAASISRSSSEEEQLLHVPRKSAKAGMDSRTLAVLRRPKALAQTNETKSADREKLDAATEQRVAASLSYAAPVEGIQGATQEKPPADTRAAQNSLRNSEEKDERMGERIVSNGYNKRENGAACHPSGNKRYDENTSNENRFTGANNSKQKEEGGFRHQQNGFRNEERTAGRERNNNRSFNRSEGFDSAGRGYNANANPPHKQAHAEEMSVKAKSDLLKMEEELIFQRDPRALNNVKQQAPLVHSSLGAAPQIIASKRVEEPIESLISKTAFTEVIVVYPMPDGTFWVHREKDGKAIEEMMRELQTKAQCYPRASELVVGEIYAVKYNDVWHRAALVSKTPLSIFYVDFGNEEPPQLEEFRVLADFPKHRSYAIRMRLSAGSKVHSLAEDSKLSVKMIDVDGNDIVQVVVDDKPEQVAPAAVAASESPKLAPASLETSKIAAASTETLKIAAASPETLKCAPAIVKTPVQQAEAPKLLQVPSTSNLAEAATAAAVQSSETKKLDKLPSTVDSLDVNVKGYVQVCLALNSDSYAVCALNPVFANEYEMMYEKLSDICAATAQPTNFAPQVGDFVCGRREKVWLRGYVVSLGPPIRLALVDEARVAPVEQVLPMPEGYEKICSFGSIFKFEAPGSSFAAGDAGQFTVTAVDTVAGQRVVRALLDSPENLKNVPVTLKNWSPTPEQKGVAFAELKSNSQVCITAYSSERIMFVQSLDEQSVERAQRLIQNVAKWAQKAPMLDGPPVIGQLVIAKFADGNFYRAIVTKLQDEKIGVSYVDYGNRDLTTIDQLRLLSDELKEERSCTAKVILKDIKSDVPSTQEVHEYLSDLVGKEEPLFCTFEGIPSVDGVILTTKTGECVNVKVNEYLTPGWQREDPAKDTKCFTVVHLEYAVLGKVGETVKGLVLYSDHAPFRYFLCPCDVDHITHVTTTMPKLLQEYCESTKVHYIPRASELCLAVYQGDWYRGLCLNPSETPTQAQIHFIDYGNTEVVNHTDIREFKADFLTPAALGCICDVKNLGIELVNGQIPESIKARLDALIPLNTFVEVKILRTPEDGEYEVELPQVRKQLEEEGLVKSL